MKIAEALKPRSQIVVRLLSILEKLPPDEVLTTVELAEKSKVNRGDITKYRSGFTDYRHNYQGRNYYGSLESIANFRKECDQT